MARLRKQRVNQERRRSARIMAMEALKEKERNERIRKEEEEEEEEKEKAKEEEIAKEEEKAKEEENDEMKSEVGDNHFLSDNEDENSRAMKKGRKWKGLEETMTFSSPKDMQEEGPHHGSSGSSSTTTGNATLEMNSRDTYMLQNDNSLFSSVLNAQSNFQLQYNQNAGGGYRESLLRFVKGMGPVAQRVAMQKLENMDCMLPKNVQLTADHKQHKPPTQKGDEDEDEVV